MKPSRSPYLPPSRDTTALMERSPLVMRGAEPFSLEGGDVGCLLVHGFTGTPREMLPLGRALAAHGYTVHGVRLFGHATAPRDLVRARWTDWLSSVEDGYQLLRSRCSHVFVGGLSMGGALALLLAARFEVSGVMTFACPYETPSRLLRVLRPVVPLLGLVLRRWPKDDPVWFDPQAADSHVCYDSYPVRATAELHDLLKAMRRDLARVHAPALLVGSSGDELVPATAADDLAGGIASRDSRVLRVERSGHNIVQDAERDRVFAATLALMADHAPRPRALAKRSDAKHRPGDHG